MRASIFRVLLLLTVPLFLTLQAASAAGGGPENSVANVNAAEAIELIDKSSGDPSFIILDVRTEEEYAGGHIEGAVNIDYRSEDFKTNVGELDTEKTYLTYCGSGRRSEKAADIMKDLGFQNIYNLSGGMRAWKEAGMPVEK